MVYCYLSPSQANEQTTGPSQATTSVLFCTRSLTSHPSSATAGTASHLSEQKQKITSPQGLCELASITSNPASYYFPLAPCTPYPLGFWLVWLILTPTSGPLHTLFLLRPLSRGLHISLPHLLQVFTQMSSSPGGLQTALSCNPYSPSYAVPRPVLPRPPSQLCSLHSTFHLPKSYILH